VVARVSFIAPVHRVYIQLNPQQGRVAETPRSACLRAVHAMMRPAGSAMSRRDAYQRLPAKTARAPTLFTGRSPGATTSPRPAGAWAATSVQRAADDARRHRSGNR